MPAVTIRDLLFPGAAIDFFRRQPAFPAFDTAQSGFHPANALWLAELCRLVYRRDIEEDPRAARPTRAEFLQRAGLQQVRFFMAGDDTQAMLVTRGAPAELAVLAFRGTENLRDWLTNINLAPVPFRNDAVAHAGFARSLDSVWKAIEPELDKLTCPVYFTGHSLGGALATLAAARRRPRALYTFGSPRVGNRALGGLLDTLPVFRVVHGADAVAEVPDEHLGYGHVGELIQIEGPPPPLLTRVWGAIRRLNGLMDHAPAYYVDRVSSWKKSAPAA